MTVLVFGSLNMDLVAQVRRLPVPGETLTGTGFMTVPGGKGGNQAVAIARLGIPTQMIGRVGRDSFGQALINSLQANGVGCDRLHQDDVTASGVAVIAVDQQGENHIIVIPGANGQVNRTDVERLRDLLPQSKALLLQLEIPLPAVIAAAEVAHQAGVTVILDPAPCPEELPADLYPLVDILTPNQIEAEQLVGFPVCTPEQAAAAAKVLHQRQVATVIVKLGQQGAFCSAAEGDFFMPAFPVEAIDTVAAGDAFNGGLAAALAEGQPLQQALQWATATAAIAVTRSGAQSSLPTRTELERFLGSCYT
jgi:ribokinase